MASKKRKLPPTLDDLLSRPICYYCDKDFDDLLVLMSHQKAKHYKCPRCSRRLTTAGGLKVHLNQVHKESLEKVENAMPGREGTDVEIFGMEGYPEDLLEQKRAAITEAFYRNEHEHRLRTGNPLHGPSGGAPKNPARTESKEDMKKRLAEFRAKKAAAANGGNAADTPASNVDSPAADGAQTASNADVPAVSSVEANGNMSWPAPANPALPTYPSAPPGQGYPMPAQPYPPSTQGYGMPVPGHPTAAQPFPMPGQAYPTHPMPGHQMPGQGFPMPGQSYSPVNQVTAMPGLGNGAPVRPMSNGNNNPPMAPLGATYTHLDGNNLPSHNLPPASGLPQRPSFSMNISKDDIARLHGHLGATPPIPAPSGGHMAMPNTYMPQYPPSGAGPASWSTTGTSPPGMQPGAWIPPNQPAVNTQPVGVSPPSGPRAQSDVADQVDDLIASILQKGSPQTGTTSTAAAQNPDGAAPVVTPAPPATNRSGRGKQTRFASLFETPEISPEEKLAQLYFGNRDAFKTRRAARI